MRVAVSPGEAASRALSSSTPPAPPRRRSPRSRGSHHGTAPGAHARRQQAEGGEGPFGPVAHPQQAALAAARPSLAPEVVEALDRQGHLGGRQVAVQRTAGEGDARRTRARPLEHAAAEHVAQRPGAHAPSRSRLMVYCSIFLYRLLRGVSMARAVCVTFQSFWRSLSTRKARSEASLKSLGVREPSAGTGGPSAGRPGTDAAAPETAEAALGTSSAA